MASILKVDDLRGNTSAGNITITSEGGAATQSLQQGIAKVWSLVNQTSTQAVLDSFNVASISDDGVGATRISFTNAFSNSNYSHTNGIQRVGTSDFANTGYDSSTTVSEVEMWSGGSAADSSKLASSIHGDLA